ncbi:hypothetical protein MTO96_030062 [Rhipicephalus appendiculatus]
METFLGGRSLPEFALTVSVLASVVNAVSVVGFLGHYYAYGFHALLPLSATPLAMLVTSTALVPLLYNMRAASIFQGGLRSVVWADCVQAIVMAATPLIIIGKVIYDSPTASPPLRPLSDFNVTQYIFTTNFDLTSEENFWSCLAGAMPYSLVRTGFDQMAVQRFIAARTLREAKRMAVTGAVFVVSFLVVAAFAALAIIYWYRDCDLALSGAISSYDQLFISLYSSAAGPFAGLVLLAISSPWVNAKGAAWACLLVCALQLWHAVGRGLAAIPAPPVIQGTMDRCPLVSNATDSRDPCQDDCSLKSNLHLA